MGDSQILRTGARTDCRFHINCLELKAELKRCTTRLQCHQVMIATDNTMLVSYINKQGGTHFYSLLHLVAELFLWLQAQDIIIRTRHIPRCLNVLIDSLSWPKQPIKTEWSLHPEIVTKIVKMCEFPPEDMFATVHNTQLTHSSCLLIQEPQALAVDALSQPWHYHNLAALPSSRVFRIGL